ncbi:hypothetical protein OHT57_02185 [Streptomyces sp. NBC_00285]|uniref:hypothetical protein n=1 Tax=Streptomyces sp. NBC_00285 TaxID=2975700 RepID=UPI002E2BD72E|nr:hypothetical protein [Streptomyces sp. NBC_00285]
MKRHADSDVSGDDADVWHERLGWAFGLIANDPAERAAALVRQADAQRNTQDARQRFNNMWRRIYPLRPKAAHRNYLKALRYSLPDALWDRPAGHDIGTWPGLPYALCFLEWEARYPQEWTRHAKSWGTKENLIQDMAAAHHDDTVRSKLVELIEIVVQRPYRCKDREYVRVARAVDGEDLRSRLERAACSDNPWAQRHAGYVLWLLDRPEVPNTRHVWRTWLAASTKSAPTGVVRNRIDDQ